MPDEPNNRVKFALLGGRIEVATETQASDAQHILCTFATFPLILPDNLLAQCCGCGKWLQHRPTMPAGVSKICFDCALPTIEKAQAKGEDVVTYVTPKTMQEVKDWIEKQKKH